MKKLASQFVSAAEETKRFADAMKQASEHIKLLKTNMMKDLLNCDGRRFRCKIDGTPVKGKIRVEDGCVYLCQDKKSGCPCDNKFGYKYSWYVRMGTAEDFSDSAVKVSGFCLLPMTAEEIEAYKDWRVGDQIEDRNGRGVNLEVVFRSGEVIICKRIDNGAATSPYTCDDMYSKGYRLVAEAAPEPEIVEVTMDEIAEKMGVPVERLRVKKEE